MGETARPFWEKPVKNSMPETIYDMKTFSKAIKENTLPNLFSILLEKGNEISIKVSPVFEENEPVIYNVTIDDYSAFLLGKGNSGLPPVWQMSPDNEHFFSIVNAPRNYHFGYLCGCSDFNDKLFINPFDISTLNIESTAFMNPNTKNEICTMYAWYPNWPTSMLPKERKVTAFFNGTEDTLYNSIVKCGSSNEAAKTFSDFVILTSGTTVAAVNANSGALREYINFKNINIEVT